MGRYSRCSSRKVGLTLNAIFNGRSALSCSPPFRQEAVSCRRASDDPPTSRLGVKPYAVEQEGRTDRLFAARDPTRVGVKEAVEQEGGTRQRLKGSDQRAWNQDWPNGRRSRNERNLGLNCSDSRLQGRRPADPILHESGLALSGLE